MLRSEKYSKKFDIAFIGIYIAFILLQVGLLEFHIISEIQNSLATVHFSIEILRSVFFHSFCSENGRRVP